MILDFTVGNFRSYRDNKTFSMEAANIHEFKDSLYEDGTHCVLPSAVIYGANSSGKSNLIEAFKTFLTIVHESFKYNSTDKLPLYPFLFSEGCDKMPSYFEINLLIDGNDYRYGFMADRDSVHKEWLYFTSLGKGREKCMFTREGDKIDISTHFKGVTKGTIDMTKPNSLFLTTADASNVPVAKMIMREFAMIVIFDGDKAKEIEEYTMLINNKELNDFLYIFNLGFTRVVRPDNNDDRYKDVKAITFHNVFDKDGNRIGERGINMGDAESGGTNKLYDIAPIVVKSLTVPSVLIIDELDTSLHPIITRRLIELFNSPESNKLHSQLIFVAHDTNLLDKKYFRRDQIWFTEKDETGATDLFSLVEFREPETGAKIRNDRSYAKDYINGRYGAIPYL